MGSWGDGLLDNDTAADEIGDLIAEVVTRATASSRAATLPPKAAGVHAVQLALIATYDPDRFCQEPDDDDGETTAALRAGIAQHRAALLQVAPKAGKTLDVLARGDTIAAAPVAPLLDAKHGRVYLQELADTAVEELEDHLDDQRGGAYLDLLLRIAPYVELRAGTLRQWLRRLRDSDDDDVSERYAKACKQLLATAVAGDDDDDDDGDDDDE